MSFRSLAFVCAPGLLHPTLSRFPNALFPRPGPCPLHRQGQGRHRRLRTACLPRASCNLHTLAQSIRDGSQSAENVVLEYLGRIRRLEGELNAFITVDGERAVERARAVDLAVRSGGAMGPLAGVPVAVKDNLCTRGLVTSAGSRMLEGFVPAYSATAVARLERAGAVVLGKTNMDEFGMGSSTETSAFGPTANPWDFNRVPGGSSGGSAAAVAAACAPAALGSDTGGSIRQPASFCGVSGLKPSYGRVSRSGLLAYASSLDTVGPIAESVEDLALIMGLIAGRDRADGTTVDADVPDYLAILKEGRDLTGITIGLIAEATSDEVDPEVVETVKSAASELRALGASVKTVSLPRLAPATAAYYVIAPSEASANLARYDGVRYGERSSNASDSLSLYTQSRGAGFGDEVKRRIMLGTFALSSGYYEAYYTQAQKVRSLVAQEFRELFVSGVDILLSPVAPSAAFRLGEKSKDPVSMYLDDIMTIPASLAGLPALSVPCGFTKAGLPIGMQIVGPFLKEAEVMKVGHAFQEATEFHKAKPGKAAELNLVAT